MTMYSLHNATHGFPTIERADKRVRELIVVYRSRPAWTVSRLFDFGGMFYPRIGFRPRVVGKTAAEGIGEDWESVGRDMWLALPAVEDEVD